MPAKDSVQSSQQPRIVLLTRILMIGPSNTSSFDASSYRRGMLAESASYQCTNTLVSGEQVPEYPPPDTPSYCLHIGTCSVLCPDGYPCACHTSDSSPAANCLGCYTPSEYHCTPSGLQSGTGQNTAGQCSNSASPASPPNISSPSAIATAFISPPPPSLSSPAPPPPPPPPAPLSPPSPLLASAIPANASPAGVLSVAAPPPLSPTPVGALAATPSPVPKPTPRPSPPNNPASVAGKLWGSLSTVVALVLAVVPLCAWAYVTLRHREEKQMLLYSISTRLKASDITDITRGPPPGHADPGDPIRPDDVVLDDQPPTKDMKDVARDIMTWCFLRWGGLFGARAGSDSMGVKLGIWNDRLENVRCAVMLLALQQVNADQKSKDPKASVRSGSLMKTWQGSTPDQKTALVTELSQTWLGISRDEAQSLPLKDLPALSLYEKVFSLVHRHKRQWEHLSSKNFTKSNMDTAAASAIGSVNADSEAVSTENMA